MTVDFEKGDSVSVDDGGGRIISGTVTALHCHSSGSVVVVEVRRAGGSHMEFVPDSEGTFNFITKVEE